MHARALAVGYNAVECTPLLIDSLAQSNQDSRCKIYTYPVPFLSPPPHRFHGVFPQSPSNPHQSFQYNPIYTNPASHTHTHLMDRQNLRALLRPQLRLLRLLRLLLRRHGELRLRNKAAEKKNMGKKGGQSRRVRRTKKETVQRREKKDPGRV